MLTGHDLPNVITRPGMRKVCVLTPYLDGLWHGFADVLFQGRKGTARRIMRMLRRHGRAQERAGVRRPG